MSSLIKWEPLSDLVTLHDAMDCLFEDSFVRMRPLSAVPGGDALALDVYETADSVVVKTSVPGVKPEELNVTITGGTLTIKGEIKAEERVEKANYIRQERRHSSFRRSVQLPDGLETDKAEATFKDGVLTLKVRKSEAAKPRTIKVEAKKI